MDSVHRATGPAVDSPVLGSAPPAEAGGDRLVLVVDDEADLLQIVSDRLVAAGYRVLTASDGMISSFLPRSTRLS